MRREKSTQHNNMSSSGESAIIQFNVGGTRFATTMSTLKRLGSNFLSNLAEYSQNGGSPDKGSITVLRDSKGALFIDRSPQVFTVVLEYLRTGALHIPPGITKEQVLSEFLFYSIPHPYLHWEMPQGIPKVADVLSGVVHFETLEDAIGFWKLYIIPFKCVQLHHSKSSHHLHMITGKQRRLSLHTMRASRRLLSRDFTSSITPHCCATLASQMSPKCPVK